MGRKKAKAFVKVKAAIKIVLDPWPLKEGPVEIQVSV